MLLSAKWFLWIDAIQKDCSHIPPYSGALLFLLHISCLRFKKYPLSRVDLWYFNVLTMLGYHNTRFQESRDIDKCAILFSSFFNLRNSKHKMMTIRKWFHWIWCILWLFYIYIIIYKFVYQQIMWRDLIDSKSH